MANANIFSSTFAESISPSDLRGNVKSNIVLNAEDVRPTQYYVHMFTVSKRAFVQPHSIYRNVQIPAVEKGQRYRKFMSIGHPVQIPTVNPDSPSETLIRTESAKRVALSICNPDYYLTDFAVLDQPVNDYAALSSGECNLVKQGVFCSMNEVPTEKELKAAEDRREAYYRFRFEEANGLARSDPKRLQEILTQDHHMAAEYFGMESSWHLNVKPKIDCPNCGDKINDGLSHHFSNGNICVINWESAWLKGAVKKEDVPDPMRWWVEEVQEKRGPGRPPKSQIEV